MFGIFLALFGSLVITPDTLLMRMSEMTGFQMLAWRGLMMGSVLIILWGFTARGNRVASLMAFATVPGLVVIVGQSASSVLFTLGIANAPVSVVLFGVATVPVFSAILSQILMGERANKATLLTTAFVLIGICVAVFGKGADGLGLNLRSALGAAAGLAVAVAMATSFVVVRKHRDVPVMLAIGLAAFASGLAALLIVGPDNMMSGNIPAITVTGIVILPISFLCLFLAPRYTHASNVSLLLLLETVLGPLWVWMGTGEAPTKAMFIGGAIVVVTLAAFLMVTRQEKTRLRAGGAPLDHL